MNRYSYKLAFQLFVRFTLLLVINYYPYKRSKMQFIVRYFIYHKRQSVTQHADLSDGDVIDFGTLSCIVYIY